MSDPFFPYYDRELGALRGLAAKFAEAHPTAAGRLRLSRDVTDDPHVERLLEGVAFLTARVQQRLDDEMPEFTDALLNVLYPHYLAPVPSASIVRLRPAPNLQDIVRVAAGTEILTDPVNGETCRFRTTQDIDVAPVAVTEVRLSGLPLAAPVHPGAAGAKSVLRLTIRLTQAVSGFSGLGLNRLRLFLGGPVGLGQRLYELLLGHAVGIALADGPNDDRPTLLPPTAIQPVGFAPEQALYPWSARAFSGFRLLTEYFSFPEKFLFLDLTGLDARTLVQAGNALDIFVYLDETSTDLERLVDANAIAVGCTPAVNLFHRRCEPIRLDGRSTDYEIVPDGRRPEALEVWSVETVVEGSQDEGVRRWRPFFDRVAVGKRDASETVAGSYLTARRETAASHGGTDLFLLPAEAHPSADRPADLILSVDALCTNRDLPSRLPFGNGQPVLRFAEGVSAVASVECMIPFTPTGRTALRARRNRRLISHLSLGHLSLVDGEHGAVALRDILDLYDFRRSTATRGAVDSLSAVSTRASVARVPGSRVGSFVRGLDVDLTFDATAWTSAGLFLLASVLDRFLALHATVNSFIRTRVMLVGRPDPVAQFGARAGDRPLL